MFPKETERHHRIKKIIIGIIVVPIALFLMLLIVGFIGSIFERSNQIKTGNFTINKQASNEVLTNTYIGQRKLLIEGIDSKYLGTTTPKLTIVEFSDFACPYCRASFRDLREIAVRYKDSVKIIFRDWPGHEYSIDLAMAAHCAGEQNKFWEMHDKLYDNQSDNFGADKNDLAILAADLGVYNTQFQDCFDNKKYLSVIQKNYSDATQLEVIGTPTWFFNGEKVEGELNYEDFEKIIKNYVSQ